jgi:hypothetical protein
MAKEINIDNSESENISRVHYCAFYVTKWLLYLLGRTEPTPYYDFSVEPGETRKIQLFSMLHL